jgi:class 3 adenylate cyclase
MAPKTLEKLLDKQKTVSLLKEFLEINPGFSACWVVDPDGRCFTSYPNRTEEDFQLLIEKIRAASPLPGTVSNYIVSPIFVDSDRVGGIIIQSQEEMPQNLQRVVQLLSATLTQLASFGIEKEGILLDALDKYREITLLYTIGETIGSCLEVDQIAQLVLQTNRRIIKAENSSLMLLNPDTQELEIKAASGLEQTMKVHLKEGVGIAGLVAQTGNPQIINDTQADSRFVQQTGIVRSLICVPLKVKEKILGVINVSNKLSGEIFTARDEKLLMTLASQAAIAIDNARLVLELKEKNKALEAALRKVELLEKVKNHLSKFVPQSVQRIIDENPEAPELEKHEKEVSILFLDIAGYTKMSESLDQPKVNYLIERYFSSFLDDIHGNKGDINETAGDGLMIIFQEPTKHPYQAAHTALAIRNKTQQINADLGDVYEPIQVNIGINSGVASVGSTKFEGITGTRWTYTASGSVTNLAARVGAFAKEGSVLVSAETAYRIWDRFMLDDLGPQQFKNVSKPVQVFRLLEEKV